MRSLSFTEWTGSAREHWGEIGQLGEGVEGRGTDSLSTGRLESLCVIYLTIIIIWNPIQFRTIILIRYVP
jgi:hypothetical protein